MQCKCGAATTARNSVENKVIVLYFDECTSCGRVWNKRKPVKPKAERHLQQMGLQL